MIENHAEKACKLFAKDLTVLRLYLQLLPMLRDLTMILPCGFPPRSEVEWVA